MSLEDLLEHFEGVTRINVFDESAFMEDVFEYGEALDAFGHRWVNEWTYIQFTNTLDVSLS